jgi:hypothetical protein
MNVIAQCLTPPPLPVTRQPPARPWQAYRPFSLSMELSPCSRSMKIAGQSSRSQPCSVSLIGGILECARSGTTLAPQPVDIARWCPTSPAPLTNAVEELHGRLEIAAELPVVRQRAQFHTDEIFFMFKRSDGEDVPGSGIGLAACRKIVEAHGEAICAGPADGGGTVMRFTIPAPSHIPGRAGATSRRRLR